MTKGLTAPLHPLEIPHKFNDRVSLDLMGPLFSDNGFKYILVITDVFSKWAEFVPLENKESETVAKAFFETWVCRYAMPKIILSDGGKEFCNKIMDDLNKELKIRHIKTSAYHPQTNASSERLNRTLISYLRSFMANKQQSLEWTRWLPVAQLSYNTQVHSSTKFSPYFLVHFHDPVMPQLHQQRDYMKYSTDWVSEALLRLNHAWQSNRVNLLKAREQQKIYYDQKTLDRNFTVGELVLARNYKRVVGGNNKFLPVWTGPYVIMKVISPTNVILKLTPHSKERNVHVNHIKHYYHEGPTPSYFEPDVTITDKPDYDLSDPKIEPKEEIKTSESTGSPESPTQPGTSSSPGSPSSTDLPESSSSPHDQDSPELSSSSRPQDSPETASEEEESDEPESEPDSGDESVSRKHGVRFRTDEEEEEKFETPSEVPRPSVPVGAAGQYTETPVTTHGASRPPRKKKKGVRKLLRNLKGSDFGTLFDRETERKAQMHHPVTSAETSESAERLYPRLTRSLTDLRSAGMPAFQGPPGAPVNPDVTPATQPIQGRQLRSGGSVVEVKLPDRPAEYKPYKKRKKNEK
jgi:hypothetical protein